jgi:hypothetical protein
VLHFILELAISIANGLRISATNLDALRSGTIVGAFSKTFLATDKSFALYPDLQKKVDVVMTQKGFTTTNWTTQFFEGKDHSEKSWAERLHIPLEFLLKK